MTGGERNDVNIESADTVGAGTAPVASSYAEGEKLGRFTVVEQLGAGGMGVVLAAYDPQLDRKVAIKLLRSELADDGTRGQTWLLREAQAMARLSHPNVVTIFDVGSVGRGVYIAMELNDGQTLTEWLEQTSRPWREIVGAFVQAGRGLAAAHDAGLVHRDFKTDNVLVSSDDRIRVSDFGLVSTNAEKLDDDTRPSDATPLAMTLSGADGLVGTPAYMSPEQHDRRDVDHRADQFSFAVALWEALYGERPFGGATYWELAESVTRGAIRGPSETRGVPARFRAILTRALQPEPEQRWPSMEALIGALEHEPWTSPRKVGPLVGIAGLAAVAVVGMVRGAGGDDPEPCTSSAERLTGVWDDAAREDVRRAFTATDRAHATFTTDRVLGALDEYAGEWQRMHTETCLATEVHREQSRDTMERAMACLAERRRELGALAQVLAGADADVVDRASMAVAELSPLDPCVNVDSLAAGPAPVSDSALRVRLDAVGDRVAQAEALHRAGRYRDGIATAEPAVADAREIGYAPLHAHAEYTLGVLYQYAGDADRAERTLREAAAAAAEADDDTHIAKAWMHQIWVLGQMRSRPDEAIGLIHAAEIALARAGRPPEIEAELWVIAGAVLSNAGRTDDAIVSLERAIALSDELASNPFIVAAAHNNLGNVLLERRDYAAAAPHIDRAVGLIEGALGPDHPQLGVPLANAGEVDNALARHEQARARCMRARSLLDPSVSPDSPVRAYALQCLGVALLALDRSAEAIEVLEQALAVREGPGTLPAERGDTRFALARALGTAGTDRARARALAKAALADYSAAGQTRAAERSDVEAWLAAR